MNNYDVLQDLTKFSHVFSSSAIALISYDNYSRTLVDQYLELLMLEVGFPLMASDLPMIVRAYEKRRDPMLLKNGFREKL